jgi:hypothetical protein
MYEGTIFWCVTQCNLESALNFGKTYRPHFQGRRVNKEGDHVIALAVSRRLPTAAARVQTRV